MDGICKTVRIVGTETDYIVINESDLQSRHVLYEEAKKKEVVKDNKVSTLRLPKLNS